jgi:hypothetical protein
MNIKATLVIRLFLSVSISGLAMLAKGQSDSQVTYVADSTNFPNPERGMYHHKEVRSVNYLPLQVSELISYREHGITLVMRVFYLEDFVNDDISKKYLEYVNHDFEVARQSGVKLLVRFAYTQSMSKPYGDATPERVLAHIDQLTDVLRRNSDVIALVQAGFIGAWGEWYYTDHFSQVAGFINEQNWIDRKALVNALLNAIPSNRFIQLRTPQYKRTITGSTDPLTPEEAFSGSDKSRLAHHNDCFLASPNDLGTYLVNIEEEKNYIEQDTYYAPLGGETCGVYVPRSECPSALAELERLHWSFLNADYHPLVISGFESNGCLPEIEQKLGYRFRMVNGVIQNAGMPGGQFEVNLNLVNDGWANPFNPRTVEIVLTNNATGKEYFFKSEQDPRRWSLSDTINITEVIGIPEGMEEGSYSVSLNMPDPDVKLYGNPDFSIRLANKEVWDAETGYNKLGVTLDVNHNNVTDTYAGTDFFLQRNQLDAALEVSPLFAMASSDQVLLYWGVQPEDPHRIIERSEAGGEFQTIAIMPGNELFFIDKNVNAGAEYTYRYHFTNGNTISVHSPTKVISLKSEKPDYYTFEADGLADEWETVQPLASSYDNNTDETYAIRFFADRDSLNMLLEGTEYSAYAVFINSDNNVATGNTTTQSWSLNGFDYQIKNDSLFQANDQTWTFISKLKSKQNERFRETSVALSSLANLGQNILVKVAARLTLSNNDSILLPFEGMEPVTLIRTRPAAVPSLPEVSNSQSDPETKLLIEWNNECSNCEGFVIERSINPDSGFEPVVNTNGNTGLFKDSELVVNTTYYYRMYAFNETGRSDYTPVVSGQTHPVLTNVEKNLSGIEVFPNPVREKVSIRFKTVLNHNVRIRMYDALGNSISDEAIGKTENRGNEIVIDLSNLQKGFYVIWIVEQQRQYPFRILKI